MLPIFTLAFELTTHFCALARFDPIPTWLHMVLIGVVPCSILVTHLTVQKKNPGPWTKCAAGLHGLALIPLLYFSLAVGPWLMLAAAGILVIFPLLVAEWSTPLTPVLATLGLPAAFLGWCVAGVRMRRRRLEEQSSLSDNASNSINGSWVTGLCVGIAALWAAEMPMVLMHGHVSRVVDFIHGDESAITSVEKLRTPDREAFLRHLCEVGLAPGNFGPLAYMYGLSVVKEEEDEPFRSLGFLVPPPHRELMHEVYFRVTGHPFRTPGS